MSAPTISTSLSSPGTALATAFACGTLGAALETTEAPGAADIDFTFFGPFSGPFGFTAVGPGTGGAGATLGLAATFPEAETFGDALAFVAEALGFGAAALALLCAALESLTDAVAAVLFTFSLLTAILGFLLFSLALDVAGPGILAFSDTGTCFSLMSGRAGDVEESERSFLVFFEMVFFTGVSDFDFTGFAFGTLAGFVALAFGLGELELCRA